MSPDDPRHGSYAGYYGIPCHDDCCRYAVAIYRKKWELDRMAGRPRTVSSLGTHRRIQALAAIGWPHATVARAADMSKTQLANVLKKSSIRAGTAQRIAAVYDELSMTPPPTRTVNERRAATRARQRAIINGWGSPLAWDDIDNDAAPRGRMCSVDECGRPPTRRGWCEMHYRRWARCGDPGGIGKTGRPRGKATYAAVHRRLLTDFGQASQHACPCGAPAHGWSYDHSDPDEQIDSRGRPFSDDLNRYQPLCISCHNRRDKVAKRQRMSRSDVDEAVVLRLLNGERIPSSRSEKDEAMRRWVAAGRSEKALCEIQKWKAGRYGKRQEAVA